MDGKYTVLVIDDDTALLKMANELLSETYTVSLAKSGRDALKLLEEGFAPDIILLDIVMPFMNGYETFEQLRGVPGARDIPVVFLTGLSEAEAELRGLQSGAVDYITKPFVKEILLTRLATHLENGRELRLLHRLRPLRKAAEPLTPWEREIALLAKQWFTVPEIAARLSLTVNTVKSAMKVIYRKLDIHSRPELFCIDL
ncbi:MAG: DNA-binding response regulator [Treponema sp.]|jgi:DNA-binding NarL/FixJ family response regulator|nr:DNA-binding response regulator [Treponema sp.]